MKKSSEEKLLNRDLIKYSSYNKDTSIGDVVLICKSRTEPELYHEVVEALLGSDTVLSYRYFGGVHIHAIVPPPLFEADDIAPVKRTLLNVYNDFNEIFNIRSICLSFTTEIGDLLFHKLIDFPVEGAELIADCS